MKPFRLILPFLLSTPAVVPLVAVLADDAANTVSMETLLASLPAAPDRVWVKVRRAVSIEELSTALDLDESRLARLNDVDEDHRFGSGDWLVVPSRGKERLGRIASLDSSAQRQSPPVSTPPPLDNDGVIRFGDTVLKLAQRYGLSVAELIRLNPGLETARLVVGSQVRLAQSAPGRTRMLLGLKPSVSGGMSWPDIPEFGDPQPTFNGGNTAPSTTWAWPTKGVFTSGYGWRWGRMHKGIDVANNVGTPIMAAKEGQVAFAGWHDGGYGYLVEIAHLDGSRSIYAHNSRLLVTKGEMVSQGQVISQMGSTGRSTGPHLHFEIHPAGRGAVNPLQMLPPRA
ncbi:M23 family metallopeptidase [Synechococcus sp. CS-1332]|nr:M23 family metallopeptidase [Synechococcus sp. CS-1332]